MTTQLSNDPIEDTLAHLLGRIAVRDATALRQLYDLTSLRLYGLAIHTVGRREWAEEVLQEAFINIWRFATGYSQTVSPPMAWMAVIVRNRALDHLRQRRAFGACAEIAWNEALDDCLTTSAPEPSEHVLSNQMAQQLSACLGQLETNQRRAITLAYFCDFTYSEVAVSMGAPLGTVKGWIRRGTEKLKIEMEALARPALTSAHLRVSQWEDTL
ncbi:RNA polymerase sigma factor [Paraburkholderia aromaticivorans]|uniref:RNA polymerase sigma factor n=1 Tax=Paraburkholderia aromaticivorans TaxID=2026199 RepID=UPI0014562225|nr:sigma-70 family RNA polymerase sigma factor [Paraburkholderia aromaticivorans]